MSFGWSVMVLTTLVLKYLMLIGLHRRSPPQNYFKRSNCVGDSVAIFRQLHTHSVRCPQIKRVPIAENVRSLEVFRLRPNFRDLPHSHFTKFLTVRRNTSLNSLWQRERLEH